MGVWQNFKRGLQPRQKETVFVTDDDNKKSIPIDEYRKQVYQEELSKSAKVEAKKRAIANARADAIALNSSRGRSHAIVNFLRGTPNQQALARKSLGSTNFGDASFGSSNIGMGFNDSFGVPQPSSRPKARVTYKKVGKHYKRIVKRPRVPNQNHQGDYMNNLMRL